VEVVARDFLDERLNTVSNRSCDGPVSSECTVNTEIELFVVPLHVRGVVVFSLGLETNCVLYIIVVDLGT
jgi:hypothetical protein